MGEGLCRLRALSGKSHMQKLLPARSWAAAAALGALLATCQPEHSVLPKPPREACLESNLRTLARWRWVEPRLSGGFSWQPCERGLAAVRGLGEVRCPAGHLADVAVSFPDEGCDGAGREHSKALRSLLRAEISGEADAARHAEEALEMLESLTARIPADPRLLSDLAAAYLLRARRMDQPADLLRSLDAAQRAVDRGRGLPEARFNLALAQEALRLPAKAVRSWERYRERDATSGWAGEADERRRTLERRLARAAAAVRPLNRQTLAQLIRPFPAATQRYLEEEALPGWARERSQGRVEEAGRHLAEIQAVARELAQRTGDPYLDDAVRQAVLAAGSPGDPEQLRDLLQGQLDFGQARLAQQAQEWDAAEELYRKAGRSFSRAGSPLRIAADLGLTIALFQKPGEVPLSQVLARLAPLEQEARAHGYRHLLGRILWIRALCLSFQGRPVEALALYDEAIQGFGQIGDRENVANLRVRKAGLFRVLGESELAWREVFQALPDLSRIVDLQSRHHLLGEAAAATLALGHPRIALLYQDQAVAMIDQALREASLAGRSEETRGLRLNLAVSLRARGAIQAHAGRYGLAETDVDQAMGLAQEPSDENIRRLLQARILEVRGTTLAASDPRRAIESLTEALQLSPSGEYRAFRASLHFQIAFARRTLRQDAEAEESLRAGIEELRTEERTILAGRQRGQGEELWTASFSRPQEAYRLLIRFLADHGRKEAAFEQAEKARAFEPLDLVLRLPFAPKAFQRLARNGEPLPLAEIQKHLPPGTVLIEYCVVDDRLLLWILWRDGLELLMRAVDRSALEQWARALETSALQRSARGFEKGLAAPYPDLIAAPLAVIETSLGGREKIERLVFIPDGPLHGLPLAALRNAETGRYLIEDFPVAVAPSATLYVYSLIRDRELSPENAPSVLLVGNPAFRTSVLTKDLAPLAHAAEEVQSIQPFYPGAVVLTGREATADRFFELAGKSAVVHFAGHAVANPRFPFRSFFPFAPSPGDAGEVYAEELLSRLELRKTRLVVLAACDTAGGHPVGPEGLAALVRPLITAGAPAVMGSLWKVNDPFTKELQVEFHRHYAAGEDAARALRNAQLDFLKRGGGYGAAISWAPFQVIGYASPPFPANHARRDEP